MQIGTKIKLSDLCKKRGQEGAELSVLDTSLRCNNPLKGPSYDKMRVFSFANYLAWKEQSGALDKCKKIRILYVYGYGGSRLSSSVEKLRRHLPEDRFEVFCYEYPQRDCWMALQFLKQKIGIHHIDMVMGSSLGAFITLCLDVDIPKIIVNPCLVPTVELPKLKGNTPSEAFVSTYAPFESDTFAHIPAGSHCFMGDADELFGDKYLSAMSEHLPTELIPSGHKLSDEAMPTVAQYILQYFHSQELAMYEEQYHGLRSSSHETYLPNN